MLLRCGVISSYMQKISLLPLPLCRDSLVADVDLVDELAPLHEAHISKGSTHCRDILNKVLLTVAAGEPQVPRHDVSLDRVS